LNTSRRGSWGNFGITQHFQSRGVAKKERGVRKFGEGARSEYGRTTWKIGAVGKTGVGLSSRKKIIMQKRGRGGGSKGKSSTDRKKSEVKSDECSKGRPGFRRKLRKIPSRRDTDGRAEGNRPTKNRVR